jgi:hypothetical protein
MSVVLRELLQASRDLPGRRSFRLLTAHDVEKLQVFYESLNFEERRQRFGAAVSDAAIRRHCAGIDWTSTIVIARTGPYCLEAAATIIAVDAHRAEVAVAYPRLCNPSVMLPKLLRLSAIVVARELRCEEILVDVGPAPEGLMRMLRDLAPVRLEDDCARIDVREWRSRPLCAQAAA